MNAPKPASRILSLALALAGVACLPPVVRAQSATPQQPTSQQPVQPGAQKDPKPEDWKPATLPSEALAYGAALVENAPPKLKKWCESYAKKKMPKQPISPRATMAVVDQQLPKASEEARDAATFLVFYLAYQEEDKEQRQLAARIRRMDEEAYDISRRMQVMKETEQNLLASTRRTVSQQEMLRNDEEARELDQRLRNMSEERKVKSAQLDMLRKRVDGYLKVLDVTHARMTGIAPAVLRTVQ